MPGPRGRPASPWWTHFQRVEGKIYNPLNVLSLLTTCSGDFRLARCLHCDQIVRRGKVGCSARETSNSGMAHHMRSKHTGSVLNCAFSTAIVTTQVQRRVDAAKEAKKTVDPKDETVRGSLPLFKLRSREDREQWRKLAFPAGETVQVGAEYRKYTSDSAIMATIILDLQPFNQVNR